MLGVGSLESPTATGRFAAHPYFAREVSSNVKAQLANSQARSAARPSSPAARAGLRLEAKFVKTLYRAYGSRFASQLQFTFLDQGKIGAAIFDGLLLSRDARAGVVIECKLRHSGDAFFQLNKFYLPIARSAFKTLRVVGLEACLYYDPHVRLLKPGAFVESPEEALEVRDAFHPILILDKFGKWS